MLSLREYEMMILRKLELILGRVGGGGSKSNDRKSKLRAKNFRLHEQRKRRNQDAGKQKKLSEDGFPPTPELGNNGDVHPSRRSRVVINQDTSFAYSLISKFTYLTVVFYCSY